MLPPNQPVHSPEWLRFRSWFLAWSLQDASQKLTGLGEALTLLRPRVARAVMGVRRRLALLPDESTSRDRILPKLLALQTLPEEEAAFQLWLESQILRGVVEERASPLCSLESLNPAWQELRCAIHRLPRVDRRTLLHALMPFSVDFPQKEADQGMRRARELWQKLAADFPAEAIPESWNTEALEVAERPVRTATLLEKGLFSGESESTQRDRYLVGSLAKNLFELALHAEAKVESPTPFILDSLTIGADEEENVDFLRRWRDSARPLLLDLGIPEEVLAYLGNLSKAPFGQGSFATDTLLEMAGRLGYSKVNVLYSLGAHAMREGSHLLAQKYFDQGLQCATEENLVGVGLANIAATSFKLEGVQAAKELMEEAQKIAPWSRFIRMNMEGLRHFLWCREREQGGER